MNTQAIAWYYYKGSFWDIFHVLVNAALVPRMSRLLPYLALILLLHIDIRSC